MRVVCSVDRSGLDVTIVHGCDGSSYFIVIQCLDIRSANESNEGCDARVKR
jgi:hypothetical protein